MGRGAAGIPRFEWTAMIGVRYLHSAASFAMDIFCGRELLWEMTKKDFQVRYLGSYLGILWAFIQPVVTVLIFWFVFEVGFKSRPVDSFPFILWLVTGMFPWFFISDSISSATGSITENSYLVKKVVFRVSLLPVIKLFSALIIHLFFVGILILMYAVYGFWPTLYTVQVIYYIFATSCLLLGISWLTSAIAVFLKDVGQIVGMLLQFSFWGTPIFWSVAMVPEQYDLLFKLNPFFYLIDGYRNCFIYHKWFWELPQLSLYYWGVTGLLMICGAVTFKKLRPHFADVL